MALNNENDQIVVLDLRDSPWYDGPGRTIIEVASGLKSQAINIKIATFVSGSGETSDYLSKAMENGLDCLEINETKMFDSAIIDQIVAIHELTPVDIIHTHEFRSNLYGLIVARKLKIPIISTSHGWITNSIKRKLFAVVDKLLLSYFFNHVIAVSDDVARKLKVFRPNNKKLITVHNTLDTRQYRITNGDSIRRSLNIDHDTPLIAKIGRLSPEKRQGQLITAAKKLVDEGYDFRLLLIGIGPDEDGLRQMTEEMGLTGVVSFTGFVQEMQPVYSELDLVVQTSSTEGLPNVILESMLMRVPVIATDVGGTSEVINSSDVGSLIEPDNEEMLLSELRSFLDSPEIYQGKIDKAEDRIRRRFDSDIRLEKMASLYRKALNR